MINSSSYNPHRQNLFGVFSNLKMLRGSKTKKFELLKVQQNKLSHLNLPRETASRPLGLLLWLLSGNSLP